MTAWTVPATIQSHLQRLWDRGRLLTAHLDGEALFPLNLPLKRPESRELSERFEEVRQWIRELEDGARPKRGFGYEIVWGDIDHRNLGRNRVPRGLVVPTREDGLRLIGKQRAASRYDALATATLEAMPQLRPWILRRPLVLLENGDDWESILRVVAWFRDNPRPQTYLRQLEIPGVDTKFIERRKPLLTELFDLALAPQLIDANPTRHFETRYGLLSKPTLVRFRILDARHRLAGLSDVSTTAAEFTSMSLSASRVFITENEINGLAFPELPDSVVVFGQGYALERLADVPWLQEKEINYWGNIDTHGFAILDRLRAAFPHARSLLMDRETLLAHRALWVREDKPHLRGLSRLTSAEAELFADLAANRLGEAVRLEQERIAFGAVRCALGAIAYPRAPKSAEI